MVGWNSAGGPRVSPGFLQWSAWEALTDPG